MDESFCPACGAAGSSEMCTVDRLGIRHWFRQCPRCGQRWSVEHVDPARDNPHARAGKPSWRPDPPSPSRHA